MMKSERASKNFVSWLFCPFCCIVGSLMVGIILAIVIVLWLRPSSSAIIYSSLSSITSRTTATTTTASTTTTSIRLACGSSCATQTWVSSANTLAKWSFDGNTVDTISTLSATRNASVLFSIDGYVNEAIIFNNTSNDQFLSAPFISLARMSFTIEAWIFIIGYSNPRHHSIFGICPTLVVDQCLFTSVINNGSGGYLYFGFYQNDCQGSTSLTLNTWIHVAFVFDNNTLTQSIYQNGIVDAICTASSAIQPATTGSNRTTIGGVPNLVPVFGSNTFRGYLDELTVFGRSKSSCEIYEDATLSVHMKFDGTSTVTVDSGPNALPATTKSTTSISSGRFLDALSFNRSLSSYFQILSVRSLGISNRPFSFSLWIRPNSLSGVIMHVSTSADGYRNSRILWCLPLIGFASNGSIVAQSYSSSVRTVYGQALPISSDWTHVVETWSSTTGLRLYLNGILVDTQTSVTTFAASGIANFVTLGNALNGTGTCFSGAISRTTPFDGFINDFRIYSRVLTDSDICTLFNA